MKTIDIETIDDDIAESDEQVVFLLSNVTAGTLGTTATAYLNIIDNEESEKAIFAMSADEITVDRSAGKATVIINRVSGNNKIASVVIGTGSGTAKAGTDYEEVTKEVVFPQGVTFQQVEIPLKNYEGAPENAQFQVALDPEKSFVEEGCAITTINLTNENAATEVWHRMKRSARQTIKNRQKLQIKVKNLLSVHQQVSAAGEKVIPAE